MLPQNLNIARRLLLQWEAQGFQDDPDNVSVDTELESFSGGSLPRLALRISRRGRWLTTVYGYQTRANMNADNSRDPYVAAIVFADPTNANNDLYSYVAPNWTADPLWGMSNIFKAVVTSINASQTLQSTTPTPGAPGAGVPADGVNNDFLSFTGSLPDWITPQEARSRMNVPSKDGVSEVGLASGNKTTPYMRSQADSSLVILWGDPAAPRQFSTPGYQKLPSGLIIQWGLSYNSGSDYGVTFPMAFPNSLLFVSAQVLGNTGLDTLMLAQVSDQSQSGFAMRTRKAVNGGTVTFASALSVFWQAIGV